MTSQTFNIPGEIQPQGRARARIITPRGGKPFVSMYDPPESEYFKKYVATAARAQGVKPMEGVLEFHALILMPRPQRLCRKKDPTGRIRCGMRPDCSNLVKGIEDALNELAYQDDGQISRLVVDKFYHAIGEAPGATVTIRQIPDGTETAAVTETTPTLGLRYTR